MLLSDASFRFRTSLHATGRNYMTSEGKSNSSGLRGVNGPANTRRSQAVFVGDGWTFQWSGRVLEMQSQKIMVVTFFPLDPLRTWGLGKKLHSECEMVATLSTSREHYSIGRGGLAPMKTRYLLSTALSLSRRRALLPVALVLLSLGLSAQAQPTTTSTSNASNQAAPSRANAAAPITLHWTDRGVGSWNANLRMFDNFSMVPDGGVAGVPTSGQILMPMPALDQLPGSERGWQDLSDHIYQGLKQRIQSSVATGNTNIELLQVENVNLAQHLQGTLLSSVQSLDPGLPLVNLEVENAVAIQQNNVKFAEAVGQAIYRVQQDPDIVAGCGTPSVDVFAGSNAGRTMPDAIVGLAEQGTNPVNSRVKLDDSRGGLTETEAMLNIVGPSMVDISNTAGDAPAFPEIMGGTTIANRDVAHQIKMDFPGVHEYEIQPAFGDLFSSLPGENHIMLMKSDSSSVLVSEFTGSGYTDPKFFLNPTDALLHPEGSGLTAPDPIEPVVIADSVSAENSPTATSPDDQVVVEVLEQARQRDAALRAEQERLNQEAADLANKLKVAQDQSAVLRQSQQEVLSERESYVGMYHTTDGGQTWRVNEASTFDGGLDGLDLLRSILTGISALNPPAVVRRPVRPVPATRTNGAKSTAPAQTCSGAICCTSPYVPNPAAVACANAPLFIPGTTTPNACEHGGGGPTTWLAQCILP